MSEWAVKNWIPRVFGSIYRFTINRWLRYFIIRLAFVAFAFSLVFYIGARSAKTDTQLSFLVMLALFLVYQSFSMYKLWLDAYTITTLKLANLNTVYINNSISDTTRMKIDDFLSYMGRKEKVGIEKFRLERAVKQVERLENCLGVIFEGIRAGNSSRVQAKIFSDPAFGLNFSKDEALKKFVDEQLVEQINSCLAVKGDFDNRAEFKPGLIRARYSGAGRAPDGSRINVLYCDFSISRTDYGGDLAFENGILIWSAEAFIMDKRDIDTYCHIIEQIGVRLVLETIVYNLNKKFMNLSE